MTRDECLRMIEEALDVSPNSLTEDVELSQVEGWDSVGHLSLMAAYDSNLGIIVQPAELQIATLVGDLLRLAAEKLE